MASRHGARASGTDGTDFRHRERVAPQYNISTINKRRIRIVFFFHFLLWVFMLFRLLPEIGLRFGYKLDKFLGKVILPRAHIWEYVWFLCSLTPTLFGLMSLGRNRYGLMRISIYGCAIFAMGPVIYGMCSHGNDLMQYYYSRKSKQVFLGFPVVVLAYIFFAICTQVHMFSIYFGWILLKAWSPSKSKRN